MAMSNAERQRKYRMNRDANSFKRQKYLQEEKDRYHKDTLNGKRKTVADMSEREKRAARKKWRKQKQHQRKQIKELKKAILTPPNSPDQVVCNENRRQNQKQRQNRKTAKCYRDNAHLRIEVEKQKKRVNLYKQRWLRVSSVHTKDSCVDSPRSKTRRLLRNVSKKTIRRTLLFHHALLKQIKTNYKTTKHSQRRKVSKLLHGSILRKYKLNTIALRLCGVSTRCHLKNEKTCLSKRVCKSVRNFYEREDVSCITTGMKRTLTRNKNKKQRRILNDTLKNLFMKYKSENNTKLSFTTFCRLRPFWVRAPTEQDRETCMCKLCANTEFMVNALYKAGCLPSTDKNQIISNIVCNQDSQECMYDKCGNCKSNRLAVDKSKNEDSVEWWSWRTRVEERSMKQNGKEITKNVTLTEKEKLIGTVSELTDHLEAQMVRYKRHSFNIKSQFSYYKQKKASLTSNQCLVHIDFAENYVCKLSSEIQSMHFGASKKQLSLHTGVYYIGSEVNSKAHTFCTVSDNLLHKPASIWAHLTPILKDIKSTNPNLNSIAFFSDGPTSQYRQKENFFMLSTEPKKFGFEFVEWNFFEAGHGKGIPDGVGGSLKRNADRKVKLGSDITSAKAFVDILKGSETDLKVVNASDIDNAVETLKMNSKKLKPIKGTMALHQIIVNPESKGKLYYRALSCQCVEPYTCSGHSFMQENILRVSRMTKQWVSQPKDIFDQYLSKLHSCETFHILKRACVEIQSLLPPISIKSVRFDDPEFELEVDTSAIDLYPDDVPGSIILYPCQVKSDGNCLPSSGSVFLHGHIHATSELRVRIVCELALNDHLYLDSTFLSQGIGNVRKSHNLSKIYAQYSDMYIPGCQLSAPLINSIFESEVLNVTTDKSFMGIWQLHALSSVLHAKLFSVYPKLGNPNVRKDLHRLIIPREQTTDAMVHIMWTSNRSDMVQKHWVPNHFVPVLPIGESKSLNTDKPDPVECINKYVLVRYGNNFYPGITIDSGNNELYVECMHQVGRKGNNCFYWPKKLKDLCWYAYDDIVCVINSPQLKKGSASHFEVEHDVWESLV